MVFGFVSGVSQAIEVLSTFIDNQHSIKRYFPHPSNRPITGKVYLITDVTLLVVLVLFSEGVYECNNALMASDKA